MKTPAPAPAVGSGPDLPLIPAAATIAAIGALVLLAAAMLFLLLYWVKSSLGIDFFPDRHLRDVLGLSG